MVFKTPWILIFIPIVVPLVWWIRQKKRHPSFHFSSLKILSGIGTTWKTRFEKLPFMLRLIVICFFIVALSGPRSVLELTNQQTEGIDIVLAIDCSGSMAAEDFNMQGKRVNRLEVVKDVVEDFIANRKNDRMSLVAFGTYAYMVCPLTTDHNWLLSNLQMLRLGLIEQGTAIGSAINTSLLRLKDSQAKSKIIILLTDGVNTVPKVDPLMAAKIAKTKNVKIYTVGVGSKGPVPYPVGTDPWGQTIYQHVVIDMNEKLLKTIAQITAGKYYLATNTETLRRIYQEIDTLEKTKIEQPGYKEYKELFPRILTIALLLLLSELILSNTLFLRIP